MSLADERSKAIRQRAGDFTLNLVKALLQTGYYSADHPLAKAATEDLFEQFRTLTQESYELSYVLLSTVDERGVMIEGILPEPIEVGRTLRGILGDHFVSKFHDYFMRNRIATFTIKGAIDQKEFEAFLSLWVGWSVKPLAGHNVTGVMSDELARRGILHVTLVGLDEVVGAARHLSWPIKVALSRLRKDLSRLPILREARSETLAKLKAMVIGDVVRPIIRPDMVRDLLLNADLACEGLADVNDLEVEDAVVAGIAPKLMFATAQVVLDYFQKWESDPRRLTTGEMRAGDRVDRESMRRVVSKLLTRLASLDLQEARATLEAAFRRGLIAEQSLPDDVRRHLKAADMTDRFVAQPDAYFKDFDECGNPRTYLKYLNVLATVVPVLLQRNAKTHVASFFEILSRHLHDPAPPFVGRARFIEETVKVMERTGVLDDLLRMTVETPKEQRAGLEAGIAMFGGSAVPGVVLMLASSEDVSIRRAATGILSRIGAEAVPLLVDELRSHRHGVHTARSLIQILGELQASPAVEALVHYGQHPNEKVREDCLNALVRIKGEAAEPHALGFLEDKDETVVRRAIHHLGSLHCTRPEFLSKLIDTVRLRHRSEDEPHDWLQVACLRALAEYENVPLDEAARIEETLVDVVQPPGLKRILPGGLGVRTKSQDLVVLAIHALGAVGSGRALSVLSDVLANKTPALREAAYEAGERIRARQTAFTTQKPLKV
jgi:HEAT repeat protein